MACIINGGFIPPAVSCVNRAGLAQSLSKHFTYTYIKVALGCLIFMIFIFHKTCYKFVILFHDDTIFNMTRTRILIM